MRIATTTEALASIDAQDSKTQRGFPARLIGLAIASIVPAAFWSVIIELVALWLGKPLASSTIAIIGGAIALFLFAVCAPLMLRKSDTRSEQRISSARATSTRT